MIPAIMAKTAACIDPYFYAVTHPRFRSELNKLFCKSRGEQTRENIKIGKHGRGTERGRLKLDRAESSFCDESTVSMDIPVKC